jgi:hypothetical protein
MRHPTEGVLRRLLDEPAGVADRDRRHVAGCPQCLEELAATREDAVLVGAAMAPVGVADVDVDAAWRRLSSAGLAAEPAPAAAAPAAAPVLPRGARSRGLLRPSRAAALAVAAVLTGRGSRPPRAGCRSSGPRRSRP